MKKIVSVGGAGLAGCTTAAIFKNLGYEVHVYETRNHIGGNCYDSIINGVRIHNYGPHIFHTNDCNVWKFMKQFTSFNNYHLIVKGRLQNGKIIPIPFNLDSKKITGKKSYEWIRKNIFQHYSEKQWGRKFKDIPKSITDRVITMRQTHDAQYFYDAFQGIPTDGYTNMFEKMLEGCHVYLNQSFFAFLTQQADRYIFTGSLDELCQYRFGSLEYRSLEFTHTTCPPPKYRLINECNNRVPWTRMYDQNQWHLDEIKRCSQGRTVVTREYPASYDGKNIRMYPFPDDENLKKHKQYTTYVKQNMPKLTCLGRLAWFQYVNMDQVVRGVLDAIV